MSENQRIVFAQNLNRYMKMRGIDQTDIVTNLKVPTSTVSDWVTGKRYPRVDSMQRLADYLGILISDLTRESFHLSETFSPAFSPNTPAAQKLRELGEQLAVPSLADPSERELVNIYRDLNALGQQTLMGTARGLSANPDMKKNGGSKAKMA